MINLTLREFLDVKRKLPFPNQLIDFHPSSGITKWHVFEDQNNIIVNFNSQKFAEYKLANYLSKILPPFENVIKVHNAITSFANNNVFLDGLPIYILRGHSGVEKDNISIRRRGWLTKYNNAYVVYTDNFIARHVLEFCYYVSSITSSEIEYLFQALKMPLKSRSGTNEKIHCHFQNNLTPITSGSMLYVSHLFDVKSDYEIDGKIYSEKEIRGNDKTGKFGYGESAEWENGNVLNGKGVRRKNITLDGLELKFLRASTIRFLSPFNFFPFVSHLSGIKCLRPGSITGEDEVLRKHVLTYFRECYGEEFNKFHEISYAGDSVLSGKAKRKIYNPKITIQNSKTKVLNNGSASLDTTGTKHKLQNALKIQFSNIYKDGDPIIYSTPNKSNGSWWLNPSFSYFEKNLFILLFTDKKKEEFYLMNIPAFSLNNLNTIFQIRSLNGKSVPNIIIPHDDNRFIDQKGFDFTPFIVGGGTV